MRIAKKLAFAITLISVLIIMMIGSLWVSLKSLSAVRAYVAGEGLWSKAQKDAVYSLQRYGKTHEASDYQDYQTFLRVNDGDKIARLELEKKDFDFNIAYDGFLAGKNHPDDIPGLIYVFRWCRQVYYIDKAIYLWAQADSSLVKLDVLANRLKAEINTVPLSNNRINRILFEIDVLNQEITYIEDDFSYTLGQGARWLENLLLTSLITLMLAIGIIAVFLSRSISKTISQGIDEIVSASKRVSEGNYTKPAAILTKDELGGLAQSFNHMSDALLQNSIERDNAVHELKKETAYVKLLQTVAIAANQAATFTEAVQICIDEVCDVTGWPIGHLYLIDPTNSKRLLSTTQWSNLDLQKYQRFKEITESTSFEIGIGLPGRILLSHKPEWIFDLEKDTNFPRLKVAQEQGIKSALAFPLIFDNKICGVLEFFSDKQLAKDDRLLELVSNLGTQLGRLWERKKSETILNDALSQIRAIVNTAYDAFVLIDNSGSILDWNPQAELTFGWKKEEVLGRKLSEIIIPGVHRENHEQGIKHFNKTGDGPVLNKRLELPALNKAGEEFLVEFTISAIENNGTHLFAAFLRNITERKREEQALYDAKEQAVNSEKIKQLFLANMSHEIRTPMNAIIGFARILEESNLLPEQEEAVAAIRQSGDNLLVILNDILDFSKIEAGKITLEKVKIDLQGMIGSTISMLKDKVKGKAVRVSCSVDPNIPEAIIGDAVRLNQILLNLVSNAVKFTEKGVVHVVAKRVSEDEESIVIAFSVEDTGIGIPADKLESIFESFTQATYGTTRKFGGTGLGLAIAKQLVELQGGTMSVKSELKKGTTFTFTMPFLKNTHATTGVEHKTPSKSGIHIDNPIANPEQIKVLLVEDNPINQLLSIKIFSRWGFELDIAENGKLALDKLEEHTYNLILMDLQMPEMDGYETTAYIRTQLHQYDDLPIVAMTAHAIKDEKDKCLAIGMNDYISKPFDPKELYALIVKYGQKKIDE